MSTQSKPYDPIGPLSSETLDQPKQQQKPDQAQRANAAATYNLNQAGAIVSQGAKEAGLSIVGAQKGRAKHTIFDAEKSNTSMIGASAHGTDGGPDE